MKRKNHRRIVSAARHGIYYRGGNPDFIKNLDKIVEWDKYSPWNRPRKRGSKMQRTFTLELRVDYADSDKNDIMRQAFQAAARHVYATASLLSDGVKPIVAIFGDDFFSGQQQIELLEDTIQQGKDEIGGQGGEISNELLNALRK